MRDHVDDSSTNGHRPTTSATAETSRRGFLQSSAGVLAAGTAVLPGAALAQGAGAPAADAELGRLQGARRILLKGGLVLSLDRQVGDFARADVLIEDGKIREVRPDIAVSDDAAAVIDAANRIVIPGFVDTHSHSYQGLLRNILTNGVLNPDYNRDIQSNLTPAYLAADAYAGVLITALGLMDMGTTTIVDISQVSHTPEHSDACIHALRDSGIRAVYAYYRGAGPATQFPQDITRIQRTYFNSKDQLLTLALGTSIDAKLYGLAREVGVPAVLHLNRLSGEILELGRAGLLRPGDEYIHCTHLNDDAWRLIRDSGGRISLSVEIEMAMGQGLPAIQAALDHGVRPSLSSDHGATVAQDFFSVMRAVFTLQHLQLFQRAFAGEQNLPRRLSPRDLLEFATIEGARCANLENKVGTLTPGKEADIVLLAADRISIWPLNNAPGVVVNLMNPSHVETVLIGGKVKKWRGSL
ncbi:MAG: 5-methylthioadenosine/S-adenosylhomocysteine deaminase, partial [Sphingomonadales bacterium]|nr:5-methylthioadenosine/S-adenosylhomocysteine deaminase [Sphingomonadales bacterium]